MIKMGHQVRMNKTNLLVDILLGEILVFMNGNMKQICFKKNKGILCLDFLQIENGYCGLGLVQ